jgi:hypothetical protein
LEEGWGKTEASKDLECATVRFLLSLLIKVTRKQSGTVMVRRNVPCSNCQFSVETFSHALIFPYPNASCYA